MTDATQIAPGYNNTGALATLNPQPMESTLQYGERRYSPMGLSFNVSKPWKILKYQPQLPVADYNTIIAQIGSLSGGSAGSSALVTVRVLLNDRITYANFNAIIDIPFFPSEGDWDLAFWKGLEFTLRNMVAI
jgi:hypothetical protein